MFAGVFASPLVAENHHHCHPVIENLFEPRFFELCGGGGAVALDLASAPPTWPPMCLPFGAGQIEVFTWSASGQFITEAFASTFPTCVLYVVDTVRCAAPATFMANMSYACSIMYKTQLPFCLVFNKVDVMSADQGCGQRQRYERHEDTRQV